MSAEVKLICFDIFACLRFQSWPETQHECGLFQAGSLHANEHAAGLLGELGHDHHATSSMPFALPGRWTGGRREVGVSFYF